MGEVHLSESIPKVELYCFNIGGGLCSEWENYTSVTLYFLHIIRNSVSCSENDLEMFKYSELTPEKNSELSQYSELTLTKFRIVPTLQIKVGNHHPYLENIVRIGEYSELAQRKFPH